MKFLLKQFTTILTTQFARIHTSSLINIYIMLNRPITKFCNGDDVNVIAGELQLIKSARKTWTLKNLELENMNFEKYGINMKLTKATY